MLIVPDVSDANPGLNALSPARPVSGKPRRWQVVEENKAQFDIRSLEDLRQMPDEPGLEILLSGLLLHHTVGTQTAHPKVLSDPEKVS